MIAAKLLAAAALLSSAAALRSVWLVNLTQPTCAVFDAANNVVTVRSLLYPGFITYNFVGMPIWGNCYSGNGLKNVDIAFMLP
jgi:hypothetical protein